MAQSNEAATTKKETTTVSKDAGKTQDVSATPASKEHFFRTCVFRLGCCKSKKSIEWLHQQTHMFSTYAPTAVGASILSVNVGPEWSLVRARVTLLIKIHEISMITLDE